MMKSNLKVIALLASIVAITPLAIDMYLPAFLAISDYYATNAAQVQNSLSVFLLGYALGMFTFGPLVDIFGKKPLVIFGLSGYLLASVAIIWTQSIEQFLVVRFFQAFLGGAATVAIPATVRSIFKEQTAKGLSYVSMVMMVAPMVAPALGSLLLIVWPWQSIFVFLALYSLLLLIAVSMTFPNTGDQTNRAELELDQTSLATKSSATITPNRSLIRQFTTNYKTILSDYQILPQILVSMLSSLLFFSYITSVAFIYMDYYQQSETAFSWLFGINVVALIGGNFINARLLNRYQSTQILNSAIAIGLFSSVGLYASVYFERGLVYFVCAILPLTASIMVIAINSDAAILTRFKQLGGTASAVIGSLRFGSGAVAGPILAYFYDGSPLPFALLLSLGLMLISAVQFYSLYQQQKKASNGSEPDNDGSNLSTAS